MAVSGAPPGIIPSNTGASSIKQCKIGLEAGVDNCAIGAAPTGAGDD
jgi:hypothetical protein